MTELKQRILASLEQHKKCELSGLIKIFAHESSISVIKNLYILQQEGWVKIRREITVGGEKKKINNVVRTNKKMYTQQILF